MSLNAYIQQLRTGSSQEDVVEKENAPELKEGECERWKKQSTALAKVTSLRLFFTYSKGKLGTSSAFTLVDLLGKNGKVKGIA